MYGLGYFRDNNRENVIESRRKQMFPPSYPIADWARPELQTDVVNGATDYINAVFVNVSLNFNTGIQYE